MKKIVLSLFLTVALFFNASSVLAVADGTDEMKRCMQTCSDFSANRTEKECKNLCAADNYEEVSSCIIGCNNVGESGQGSCREACLTKYLDQTDVSKKHVETQCKNSQEEDINKCVSENLPTHSNRMDKCIDSCIDISDMSGSTCSNWCTSYIDYEYDGKTGSDKNKENITIVECAGIEIPYKLVSIVNTVIDIIKIAIPILLIIFGMLDLGKAVMAQKEDEIKKGQQIFIKRLIAAILVFLVFVVVQLVVGLVAPRSENENMWNCVDCFVNGDCQ